MHTNKFCAYTIVGLKVQKSDLKIIDNNNNQSYIHNYTKIDNVDGELKLNNTIYKVTKLHADDEFHYILLYEGSNSSKCPFTLELLCEMKSKMKLNLQTINLWNEDKFGIYTDGYHYA